MAEQKKSKSSDIRFTSAIAQTNSNLSKLSKTVVSTAATLANGDISAATNYQMALADTFVPVARRPSLQRKLLSFSRTPSEVLRATLSSKEIKYHASTEIPERLLKNIPESSAEYSLFQGFAATVPDANTPSRKLLESVPGAPKSLESQKAEICHKLELLDIRKSLASTEIREIDQKIARLEEIRSIVFQRMQDLEEQEIQSERDLVRIEQQIEDAAEKKTMEKAIRLATAPSILHSSNDINETTESSFHSQTHTTTADNESDNVTADTPPLSPSFMSESVYGKLQISPPKIRKPKAQSYRSKTVPTLHQYYKIGKNIRTFTCHSDSVTALDFDIPFGTLVTASLDDTVKVWDMSNGRCYGNLVGHKASVKCLQIDDGLVVTGSTDASIRLWDLNRFEKYSIVPIDSSEQEDVCIYELDAHVDEVTAVCISDTKLVSGSNDKTLRQWDLNTGKCTQTLDILWAAAQSYTGMNDMPKRSSHGFNDGDFVGALQCFDAALATGTADGIVRLWDLRTGQVQRSLIGHTGPVTSLQFDQFSLVTGSMDRSVRVWDLRMGTIRDAFAYEHPITSLSFDAQKIVTAAGENFAKIYDRVNEQHWTCGAGAKGDESAATVLQVRMKEGYLIEGRADGRVGAWAC
ncbi:hypothetical protein CANCADRAFT_113961 [Tortispora caseinolytica NRRL Y-17796]|uniref:Uncharacterized protein n=1 Tax=Tortispora caseinolytica NRRL Y-17796 TaxID=767744 RepID=A0A1E4TGS3_9ASCO|nr:hypothetical protein CANCADRAFT_113961 [Tortispora caseinolytica NRRL Y-17796]